MLRDVEGMVRLNPVSVPSGFTKLGYPILYFPDGAAFSDILESDLGGVTRQSLSKISHHGTILLLFEFRSVRWKIGTQGRAYSKPFQRQHSRV